MGRKGKEPMVETGEKTKQGRVTRASSRANRGTITIQEPTPRTQEVEETSEEESSQDTSPLDTDLPARSRKKEVPELAYLTGSTHDPNVFIDQEAYTWYQRMHKKTIIHDRGFSSNALQNMLIRDSFNSRGWQEFALHQDGWFSWELTRLFLANCLNDKSWIFGVSVPCDPDSINQHFGVVCAPRDEEFFTPVAKGKAKDQMRKIVLEAMFEQQDNVAYYPNSGDRKVVGTKMDPPFYQLYMLYRSKLVPSSHTSGPNGLDLYVVYCIKMGIHVDIGYLISSELQTVGRSPYRSTLIFPGLIWMFCERAGVDMSRFDRDLKMRPPISLSRCFRQLGSRCAVLQLPPGVERPIPSIPPTQNSPQHSTQSRVPSRGTRTYTGSTRGRGQTSRQTQELEPAWATELKITMQKILNNQDEMARTAAARHHSTVDAIDRLNRAQAHAAARNEYFFAQYLGTSYVPPNPPDPQEEPNDQDYDNANEEEDDESTESGEESEGEGQGSDGSGSNNF